MKPIPKDEYISSIKLNYTKVWVPKSEKQKGIFELFKLIFTRNLYITFFKVVFGGKKL